MLNRFATFAALVQAAVGLTLLFAPEALGSAPGAGRANVLPALLGAAFLGFAAANWIARGSALGGIYGRAVVGGNQAHFTIGALVLLRRGFDTGFAGPFGTALVVVYVLGALGFSWLAFGSTGLRRRT